MGEPACADRPRTRIGCRRVERHRPLSRLPASAGNVVALTFDDGPHPHSTEAIVAELVRMQVPATFFVVGEKCEQWPDEMGQLVDAGVSLGVHTWSHPNLVGRSRRFIASEIGRTVEVIRAHGRQTTVFRPPNGMWSRRIVAVARRLCLSTVTWSVDTEDSKQPGTDVIVANALIELEPGSIILLHDGGGGRGARQQTVEALPTLISEVRARGFEFAELTKAEF